MYRLILFFLFPTWLAAQTSQDVYVSFISQTPVLQSDTVKIWIHIPSNYPSHGGGTLLGIHGLGDPNTSIDIRSYLTKTSDSLGLILVCPEPYLGQENATLLSKSKAVINETMDSLVSWHSIDLSNTYLCGYSAGSDVSAHYTFENPKYPIKGFIWFAPGFYGSLLYSNIDTAYVAPIPPICLCRGTTDLVSQSAAAKIESMFSSSTIPFLKISPQGIGHTMNYPTFSNDIAVCMNFINQNASVNTELFREIYFKILSNPVENKLILDWTADGEFWTFEILDIFGNQLKYGNLIEKNIDVHNLPSGLYFLKISNPLNHFFVKKFVRI